jgi:Cu/Ag efflux pump CusA
MRGCADRPSASRTAGRAARRLATLATSPGLAGAIATTDGPVLVRRENGSRFALIQSNVSGRDLVGFVEEARAAVARDVPLPARLPLEWGGQFENQQRAAARLGWWCRWRWR